MMNNWDNPHCRSHAHCRACRDLTQGRDLRRQWGLRWGLPGSEVDFPCPEGHPWGFAGSKPLPVPPNPAVAVCEKCPDQRACPNVTVCCGGRITVAFRAPCKHGSLPAA
jgi:hypothetical protein